MASLHNLDIPFYPKYFKLINFNSVKKSNFNLPTNILSPEIVKAVNAKHSNKNKRKRSAAVTKRTNKKNNNYASSTDSSYKIPKQKKVKINLDEEQIKLLPVQGKFLPYPANEYVFTPHIKEATPSVLVRHPQRLDAIQIQHDFEERTIIDNINILLQAIELIEDKNHKAKLLTKKKLEEIIDRYNETKRVHDLLAIASVDIKKKVEEKEKEKLGEVCKKKLEFLELRILHYKYREFDVNNELKSIEERLHKIEEEKKVAEEELASLANSTTS